MKIIVGLGNPGTRYAKTRHNVGFMVVDLLRKRFSANMTAKTRYYKEWEVIIAGQKTILITPRTFMNESGTAVKQVFNKFNEPLQNYIVVHDDLDIPVGKLKIISDKGPGGHNGIISVIRELGSKDFIRVRIGIGRERADDSYVNYVLSPFLPEELSALEDVMKKAILAIEEILRSSLEKAMSLYNT